MDGEQLLIGGISLVIGLVALSAAAANWHACFQLPKLQWIDQRWGRTPARLCCALLGVTFVVLGLVIATGYRLQP